MIIPIGKYIGRQIDTMLYDASYCDYILNNHSEESILYKIVRTPDYYVPHCWFCDKGRFLKSEKIVDDIHSSCLNELSRMTFEVDTTTETINDNYHDCQNRLLTLCCKCKEVDEYNDNLLNGKHEVNIFCPCCKVSVGWTNTNHQCSIRKSPRNQIKKLKGTLVVVN